MITKEKGGEYIMARGERVCANCGKKKSVYGGKICENDHFICKDCAKYKSKCPVCGKPMK